MRSFLSKPINFLFLWVINRALVFPVLTERPFSYLSFIISPAAIMRLNTIFLCTFWISIQVSSDAVMLIFPVASEIGLDLASITLLSLFLVGAMPSLDCLCCRVGFFVFCCKSVVGVLTGLLSFGLLFCLGGLPFQTLNFLEFL